MAAPSLPPEEVAAAHIRALGEQVHMGIWVGVGLQLRSGSGLGLALALVRVRVRVKVKTRVKVEGHSTQLNSPLTPLPLSYTRTPSLSHQPQSEREKAQLVSNRVLARQLTQVGFTCKVLVIV